MLIKNFWKHLLSVLALSVGANGMERTQWFYLSQDDLTADEARKMTDSEIPSGLKTFAGNLEEITDFAALTGKAVEKQRTIFFLTEINSDCEKIQLASAGADFFIAVFCNGQTCVYNLGHGNGGTPVSSHDRVFEIPLKKGKNTLGFFVQSGMGGWSGGFCFLPDTPEHRLRLSRQAKQAKQFPATGTLRYGPWLTHVEPTGAIIRFNTDGNQAVCVDYRKSSTSEFRRSYELWNCHFRRDTDRHAVTLKDLVPGTVYEFRIGVIPQVVVKNGHLSEFQQVELLSPVYRFKTLPDTGNTTRFFVTSDTHVGRIAKAKILTEAEKRFGITGGDLMLHLGDIASCINSFDDEVLGAYAEFFRRNGVLTPLVMVQGNHEYSGDEDVWWNHAFAKPSGENHYAFRCGDCLIVVMDYWDASTNSDPVPSNLYDRFAEQRQWFEKLVKSEMFRTAKYRILCNHCPPTRPQRPNRYPAVKELLTWSKQQGAHWSLMLCGHCHQRFQETLEGVPIVCLGGGESAEAISIAKINADKGALHFQLFSVSGEKHFSIDILPEK